METRELSAAEAGTAAKALVALGLAASMREARRKIAEGALRLYAEPAGEPSEIRDPDEDLSIARSATRSSCAWGAASFARVWKR